MILRWPAIGVQLKVISFPDEIIRVYFINIYNIDSGYNNFIRTIIHTEVAISNHHYQMNQHLFFNLRMLISILEKSSDEKLVVNIKRYNYLLFARTKS